MLNIESIQKSDKKPLTGAEKVTIEMGKLNLEPEKTVDEVVPVTAAASSDFTINTNKIKQLKNKRFSKKKLVE